MRTIERWRHAWGQEWSVGDAASLGALVAQAEQDFEAAGFTAEPGLLRRFVASLAAKPFVILTGQTGSGKTRMAQLFASWITSPSAAWSDPFFPGAEVQADRVTYYVAASDRIAVEFRNGIEPNAIRVTLPRDLIAEWANVIRRDGLTRDTGAQAIKNLVKPSSFSGQLNSFDTHLKAAAFALLEAPRSTDGSPAYAIVPVGADWSSTEQVLGFPDALDPSRYVRTPALDLILRAIDRPGVPHFLILDEMNMSHVERYFADLLSALESGESITLYSDASGARDGVPPAITLPRNLFIVGTVNVDETTYLFSPKVLDRANSIEFRTSEDQLDAFLRQASRIDVGGVAGRVTVFASAFLAAATDASLPPQPARSMAAQELRLLFRVLADSGYEFGLRTAAEVMRFTRAFLDLSPAGSTPADVMEAIDAQVYQKVLPKLNGSRGRLEPALRALHAVCACQHRWVPEGQGVRLENATDIERRATLAAAPLRRLAGEESGVESGPPALPMSLGKTERMLRTLEHSGFASFAEA